MKNIKKSGRKKAAIIESIGGYLNTAIFIIQGVVILPLYFKYIDKATYGYWVTIGSITNLMTIIDFGIGSLVTQRISRSYVKKDFSNVVNYFFNSLIYYIIISLIYMLVGLVISYGLIKILKAWESDIALIKTAYFTALVTMVLTFFGNSLKGFSQSLLKPHLPVISTIVGRILGLFLIIFLLTKEMNILSIAVGLLFTHLFIFLVNAIYVAYFFKNIKIKPEVKKSILYEYLQHSPHLIGLMAGNMILNQSHPLLITVLLGPELTTAYAVTRKIVMLLVKMITVINNSIFAPFSHLVAEGNEKRIRNITGKIIKYTFSASTLFFGVYITSNYSFVEIWIGRDIVLGNNMILFIGLSAIALIQSRVFKGLLYGFDEIKYASIVVFIQGIIFLIFNFIFIKILGIAVVPISLLITSCVVLFILGKKIMLITKFKPDYILFLQYTILMIVIISVMTLSRLILTDLNWFNLITKAAITFFAIGMLLTTLFLNEIKSYMNKFKRKLSNVKI